MFRYSLFFVSAEIGLIKIFGNIETTEVITKAILESKDLEGCFPISGDFFYKIDFEDTVFICIGEGIPRNEFRKNMDRAKKTLLFKDEIVSFIEKEITKKTDVFEHNISEISTQTAEELLYLSGLERIRGSEDLSAISEKLNTSKPQDIANSLLICYKNCIRIERELLVFKALEGKGYIPDLMLHGIYSVFLSEMNAFFSEFKNANIAPPILSPFYGSAKIDYQTFGAVVHFLYSNGVKYCRSDSQFEVEFKPEDKVLKIEIRMNSVFLEPEERKKIFSVKFRGEEAVKKTGDDGKGIGMMSARKLLKFSNGSIDFIAGDNFVVVDDIRYAKNIVIIKLPMA